MSAPNVWSWVKRVIVIGGNLLPVFGIFLVDETASHKEDNISQTRGQWVLRRSNGNNVNFENFKTYISTPSGTPRVVSQHISESLYPIGPIHIV